MSMQEQREVHDAILDRLNRRLRTLCQCTSTFFQAESEQELLQSLCEILVAGGECRLAWIGYCERSEEHTSELQSRQYLVCRLLLEKKKDKKNNTEPPGTQTIDSKNNVNDIAHYTGWNDVSLPPFCST